MAKSKHLVKISSKKLLSLQSRAAGNRRGRRSKGRRRRRDETKIILKKMAMGAGAGLATSIGLTLAGRYLRQPMLSEAGQRIGAIAAGHFGDDYGQVAYQIGDAIADRYLRYNGMALTYRGGGL